MHQLTRLRRDFCLSMSSVRYSVWNGYFWQSGLSSQTGHCGYACCSGSSHCDKRSWSCVQGIGGNEATWWDDLGRIPAAFQGQSNLQTYSALNNWGEVRTFFLNPLFKFFMCPRAEIVRSDRYPGPGSVYNLISNYNNKPGSVHNLISN